MTTIGTSGIRRGIVTRLLATTVLLGCYCLGTTGEVTPARAQRGARAEKSAKCTAAENDLEAVQLQEQPLQDALDRVERSMEHGKDELAQFDMLLSMISPVSAPGMTRAQIMVLREHLKQQLDKMIDYRDKILAFLVPLHNKVLELKSIRDRECK